MERSRPRASADDAEQPEEAREGRYLYGILRSEGGWPLGRPAGSVDGTLLKARYRDLEALVRRVSFEVPPLDEARLREHQRTIERMMRRTTILPAPYGIVFDGRTPVLQFLRDQYTRLDRGLDFLDGCWELRLHVAPANPEAAAAEELEDSTVQLYSECRSDARAAVPFPKEGDRLLSAGFLVERAGWIDFVERIEEWGGTRPALKLDVTGPWPPYDFVTMVA